MCGWGGGRATGTSPFYKTCSVLPELDFIVRAEEHSCVVVLRNASEKCEWLQPLLLSLVSGLSSGRRNPGAFARYVHNSPPFKRKVAFIGGPQPLASRLGASMLGASASVAVAVAAPVDT